MSFVVNTYIRGQSILLQTLEKSNTCKRKIQSISTPRLKPLRALHLEPINLVVFQGPHT